MAMGFLAIAVLNVDLRLLQGRSIDTERVFTAQVTFHETYLPLEALAADLTKQSGSSVVVQKLLRERKIAIFCRGKKISDVMHAVEQVTFGKWTLERNGSWQLILNPQIAKQEVKALQAEDNAVRNWAARKLQVATATARMTPDEVRLETAGLRLAIDKAKREKQNDGSDTVINLQDRLKDLTDARLRFAGRVLLQLPAQTIDQILAGSVVVASTQPGTGQPQLDAAMTPQFVTQKLVDQNGQKQLVDVRPTGAVGLLKFDQYRPAIGWLRLALGLGNLSGCSNDLVEPTSDELKPADSSLTTTLDTWTRPVQKDLLDIELSKVDGQISPPPYITLGRSVADQLGALADRSGIPIIADSFRIAVSGDTLFGGRNITEWIADLKEAESKSSIGHGFLTSREGWLLYRHARYWTRLRAEPRESQVYPAEQKLMKTGGLDLDDYASITAGLTDEQLSSIMYDPRVLLAFPKSPMKRAAGALKLWEALNPSQRESAKGGLSMESLSPDQHSLLIEAVNQLIWTGSVDESLIPIVFQSRNDDILHRLWFRMRTRSEGASPVFRRDERFDMEPDSQPKSANMKDLMNQNSGEPIEFVFGVTGGGSSSVGFYLPGALISK